MRSLSLSLVLVACASTTNSTTAVTTAYIVDPAGEHTPAHVGAEEVLPSDPNESQDASFARAFEFEGPHAGGFLPSTPDSGDAYARPPADGRPDTWSPSDEARSGHWMEVDGGTRHSSERWADAAIAFL